MALARRLLGFPRLKYDAMRAPIAPSTTAPTRGTTMASRMDSSSLSGEGGAGLNGGRGGGT
eukprot:1851052-Prymnesium_polylepis.1